jgi:hypothetical protein
VYATANRHITNNLQLVIILITPIAAQQCREIMRGPSQNTSKGHAIENCVANDRQCREIPRQNHLRPRLLSAPRM